MNFGSNTTPFYRLLKIGETTLHHKGTRSFTSLKFQTDKNHDFLKIWLTIQKCVPYTNLQI